MKQRKLFLLLLVITALAVPASAQKTKKSKSGKAPAVTKSATKKEEKAAAAPVVDDRITIEQLKAKLDARAQVLILDVRALEGWNSSPNKIKGAIRVPMEDVDKKKGEWNKAIEIITYCS